MARTKQTAKKSNGGEAPRMSVAKLGKLKGLPKRRKALRASVELGESAKVVHCPAENEFCMLCRDGVDKKHHIYACDECPRVMCTRCMEIPSDYLPLFGQPDVHFRCLHCHTASAKKSQATPYYGFFRQGQPILPSFLSIRGQLEFSKRSEVSAAPVLIIHFQLVNSAATGNPMDIMHSCLTPYFPRGGLRMLNVVFDLGTLHKIKDYSALYTKLANDIIKENYQIVCIAITTHTDDERGDPFLGCNRGSSVAASVPDFFDRLLSPWRDVIRCAQDATLFLLCCGAIVNRPEAFRDLRASVDTHGLSYVVAFTALHFQPSFLCHFLTAYAELIIIERFTIREAFPEILGQSYRIGMHTDVILLTTSRVNSSATLRCTRYTWAHATARPWGFNLPSQCPLCGCIDQWKRIHGLDSGTYIFECIYEGCDQRYTFSCPTGAKLLKPGRRNNACWMEVPLDFGEPTANVEVDVGTGPSNLVAP
ncbi:hypothetical protein M405DRAFT_211 [Rhizopogon salebrosus TDB-379]|nr:hypothetical protein M405DRAFT_211 [Rhizopogon salebrosus TDB-379]